MSPKQKTPSFGVRRTARTLTRMRICASSPSRWTEAFTSSRTPTTELNGAACTPVLNWSTTPTQRKTFWGEFSYGKTKYLNLLNIKYLLHLIPFRDNEGNPVTENGKYLVKSKACPGRLVNNLTLKCIIFCRWLQKERTLVEWSRSEESGWSESVREADLHRLPGALQDHRPVPLLPLQGQQQDVLPQVREWIWLSGE